MVRCKVLKTILKSFETHLAYDGKYWNFNLKSERIYQNGILILWAKSWGYDFKGYFGNKQQWNSVSCSVMSDSLWPYEL